ncbi:MAG TPA: C25 family cysteine peptidase [Thermoanaerobaculia bacterium]
MTHLPSFRRPLAALFAVTLLAGPLPLRAASTGSTALQTPQGGGTATANGEYVSTTLNTFYRYFIEVPSGLTHLTVEVFDPDIGLGGTTEANAGRDRDRNGFDSAATYSLLGPEGSSRTTSFTAGNTTTPAGSDGVWTALFDSTGDTFRDNFTTSAYTNNDGTLAWSTNWLETNDDNSATGGNIRVTGGELRVGDNGDANPSSIQREADLSASGVTSATLSFNFRTSGTEATDQMAVQVSSNGGGSWTTLETFTGAFASSSRSYDISSYIASNTRVRFLEITGYGNNDFFFVDNLQIKENNIRAGHWELRVDMSASAGDDINAIGVRAHDGDSTSGGTELPVYIDSIVNLGVNPPATGTASRTYTLYPYVTSGCTANSNDFDYDSNSGTVGSLAFASRTGAYTQTVASASLSGNDAWARNTINRWTSDQLSTEYGIWTGSFTIDSYLVGGTPNGNYTDLYIGNSQVSATVAPTANPQPNSFRIYLPTDGGSAPVKPYAEQILTFKSGTNPPAVGQTAKYQVTVRVVNPTAQSITFSSSNLVTANVPGGGATYAGNAAVGQGTIVSQPSVGGTGNITWNPGTVAAGATTILTYQVNVTPTSAGQRIPVTGTPASNGTTAKYLDETGNTTQTRATFTFGPLCELAVTQGLLTEAVVSGFHASPADGGGVLLEWQTASEAGTAGFYVQRWNGAAKSWERVGRELLAGLLHAPQGGTYRFVDPEASPYEPQAYRLVEVEAGGQRHTYGPFAAQVDWSRRDPRQSKTAYERGARPPAGRGEAPKPLALKAAATANPDGVHLSVRQTGLIYLSAASVGSWLGLKPDEAVKAIGQGKVALTKAGQPVAWYPDLIGGAKAQGLFFYGEAPDSPYTDTAAYRLSKGPGLLMQTVPAGTPATAGGSFPETRHVEKDLFAATVISPDPNSDYWFWDFLQGNDPTYGHRTYTLDAPGLAAAAGVGTLAVNLQGATASGFAGEHQAQVSLNGTPLGETSWTGITPQRAVFSVPAGLLQESGNQVDVTAVTGGGAPYSIWYVDSFDLSYPRLFRAAGDALAFTAGGAPGVSVGGFTSSTVRLVDVQDPLHPRWIAGATAGPDGAGGFQLRFVPSATGKYVAAAPAALVAPAAVRGWSAPSLLSTANRADYLVIAPAAMRDAAERLADTRRAQGMTALVADLDQIMDTFNGGVSDPRAIRSFLSYAHTQWSQGPRYVALAGAGTFDYRNLLGFGDGLVPPLMIQTDSGLYPSDGLLGDVDGDGLPEVAIGRIPVLSAAELDAYTAKLTGYESTSPANWTGHAVMTADDTDRGADFGADSDEVAGHLPPAYQVDRVYLKDLPLAAARGQLMAAIGGGTAFLNYMGHGALDRLSAGGLLTSADVPGLGNNGRLPVLTAMTCTINRFEVPGTPSLGETLVKDGQGGAAAVWGPTGLSANGEAKLLAERFYNAADARLGDRLLRAIADFRTLGGNPDLPRLYVLLGDPALRLPAPPAPGVTPSEPGE